MKSKKADIQVEETPGGEAAEQEVQETAPGPQTTTAGDVPTPEQIAEWQAEAAKAQEHWNRLLRTSADFDNFKKRAAREKEEAIRYANERLFQKLLPVLDSFEMAMATAGSADDAESFQDGIGMILQQFKTALSEAGLEEIDAEGQAFDPNLHEAVSQLESEEVAEGHVLQQIRKGYKLQDRLVRPASVVVAKAPTG